MLRTSPSARKVRPSYIVAAASNSSTGSLAEMHWVQFAIQSANAF